MICRKRELPAVIRSYRASGKKIVFTNGCFDIIHPGHIRILKKARMLIKAENFMARAQGNLVLILILADRELEKYIITVFQNILRVYSKKST